MATDTPAMWLNGSVATLLGPSISHRSTGSSTICTSNSTGASVMSRRASPPPALMGEREEPVGAGNQQHQRQAKEHRGIARQDSQHAPHHQGQHHEIAQ